MLIVAYFIWDFNKEELEDEEYIGDESDEILNTLKMRYVKGEISKKEFEDMKKDIED